MNGARGVIINVTGGPDLSLMEVNEASCVIQEAAHEDANIIFGAVVDPTLKGKVKITVIATGFDRQGIGKAVPATTLQTPVDLHNYTAHLSRATEAVEGEVTAAQAATNTNESAAPAGGIVPQFTVSRRPGLDMPLPLTLAAPAVDGSVSPEIDPAGGSSPLDVPAFLRRQS